MARYLIRGTSGSGKTTLGKRLAACLQMPFIDMDDLYWLPGWQSRSEEEFRANLERALSEESWVLAGNYSRVQPYVLTRAQAVVWLDYPFRIVLGRLLVRTARRCASAEPCCNGNRESWRLQFSRNSILWWCVKTFAPNRRKCQAFMTDPEYAHLARVWLRHPKEAEQWLRAVESEGLKP